MNFPVRSVSLFAAVAMLLAAQDQTPGDQKPKTGAESADHHPKDHQTKAARPDTGTRSRQPDASDMMVNTQESKFMTDAAMGGMVEVKIAQLAQQKASSDAVKQFAAKLEKDHTAANEELKKLAANKNVNLPTDIGPKHQAEFDKLNRAEGAAFDRAFSRHAVNDHKKAIGMYERAERNSLDSDVKAFAAKQLPTLREHLTTAQNLASQKPSAQTKSSDAKPADPAAKK